MDSEKLKKFIRLSTIQVKVNGGVSSFLALEMIGYIRQLERVLDKNAVQPSNAVDVDCPHVELTKTTLTGIKKCVCGKLFLRR